MADSTAADILRDSQNMLAGEFEPGWRYSLLNQRFDSALIAERINAGWELVRTDIQGSGSKEVFSMLRIRE